MKEVLLISLNSIRAKKLLVEIGLLDVVCC